MRGTGARSASKGCPAYPCWRCGLPGYYMSIPIHIWIMALAPIAIPLILAMIAVYLLLPRPRPHSRIIGASVGAGALLTGGMLLVQHRFISTELILFYAFA